MFLVDLLIAMAVRIVCRCIEVSVFFLGGGGEKARFKLVVKGKVLYNQSSQALVFWHFPMKYGDN